MKKTAVNGIETVIYGRNADRVQRPENTGNSEAGYM